MYAVSSSSGQTTLSKIYLYTSTDAGIHVFRGNSTGDLGSLSNNGIVIANNTDPEYRFHFTCRSDSMKENVGTLIRLDGTNVTTGGVFRITHPQAGELRVKSRPMNQSNLTASDQGVYTCRIPLQNGTIKDINIGIYPSGFSSKYCCVQQLENECTLPWQTLFPTLIALKGGHIQGSLLYQCTLNQLMVSLGEGLKSSASPRSLNSPHPN